ncbi:MAG: lysostaphin resistance A-like protein [Mycobacterium leprae]
MPENLPKQESRFLNNLLWLLALVAAFYGTNYGAGLIARALHFAPLTAALLGEVVILLLVLLFVWLDRGGFSNLGLLGRWESWDSAAVAGIVVVQWVGSFITAAILQVTGLFRASQGKPVAALFRSFGNYTGSEFVLLALVVALAAGVSEELLFRGYLMTRLERARVPGWACVGISALVFGLVHVNGYGILPALSKAIWMGIPAGLYFWRRRNLGPLIIAHTLIDFLGFLLTFLVLKVAPGLPGL